MAIFSIIFLMLIIWLCMWIFFKFMYPKPPKAFMPQSGDIVTPRKCDYCGYPLATYRGIVETKPLTAQGDNEQHKGDVIKDIEQVAQVKQGDSLDKKNVLNVLDGTSNSDAMAKMTRSERKQHALKLKQQQKRADEEEWTQLLDTTWFFCNAEHQSEFHKGKTDSKSH